MLFLVILSRNICCVVVSVLNNAFGKYWSRYCAAVVNVDGQAGAESTCASAAYCTATQY